LTGLAAVHTVPLMASRKRRGRSSKSRRRDRQPISPEPDPSSFTTAPLGRLSKRLTRTQRRAERAHARADEHIAVEAQAEAAEAGQAPAAPPVSNAEQRSARLERMLQRAKDSRARARAKAAARAADPKQRAKRDKLVQAMDRFYDPPKLGLFARLAARITSWRRRRVHRAMVRKLDRALARGTLRIEDQQSAALLDVITERIARLSNTSASSAELDATIALAQRLSNEYRAYVDRLGAARAATAPTAPLYAKATRELARCEAGRQRIDDALGQLRALARRIKPPG